MKRQNPIVFLTGKSRPEKRRLANGVCATYCCIAMALSLTYFPGAMGQDAGRAAITSCGGFYPSAGITLEFCIGEAVNAGFGSAEENLSVGFLPGDGRRKLLLLILPEGLWNGTGLNKAKNENGPEFEGPVADRFIVSVYSGSQPQSLHYTSEPLDLLITGAGEASLPAHLCGNNYLVVNHRNHIETWSSAPVSLGNPLTTYSFAQSALQAFGNNLKEIAPGIFALYAGDANKDGLIDSMDIDLIASDAAQFLKGYTSTDINGDGRADARDLIITDNNAAVFIQTERP